MIALIAALSVLLVAFYKLLFSGRDGKFSRPESKKPTFLQKLLDEAFEHVPEDPKAANRILVLYGTEYGFSREVALKLAAHLAEAGLVPRVVSTLHYRVVDFTKERFVAIACSTTGDGVPPNEAADFREALVDRDVVMPENCCFSVLALGDRAYPHFCRAGVIFDELFGENRLLERVDIDQEDWQDIDEWIDNFTAAVEKSIDANSDEAELDEDYLKAAMVKYAEASQNQEGRYSRNEPFMATLVNQELLTAPRTGAPDDKEVIRVEFDISGSGIQYDVGDAVGVVPLNNSEHVTRLLLGMASGGDEMIRITDKGELTKFEHALTEKLDIRHAKPELVQLLAQRARDDVELQLAEKVLGYDAANPDVAERNSSTVTAWGKQYLAEREVFDVLGDFVTSRLSAQELTDSLRPLHARYYSISSTSRVTPDTIAATVDVMRYETLNVEREGVASTFLKDRCKVNKTKVGVFISKNTNFRLPTDDDRPIIMIGPGTGIAPFIGFIEERIDQGARGENWLFFGCRHEKQDFLYGKQLKDYADSGKLRLQTAFSRDGPEKVYVQHKMAKCAKDMWRLLEGEAHIYVCGDGGKMAEDVDAELQRIVQEQGHMSVVEATDYLTNLSDSKRYQRDVWVS